MQLFPGPHYRVIDRVGMPQVTRFIARALEPYDTSALEWLKLLPLVRKTLLHGICEFPWEPGAADTGEAHGYRIRASVNVEMAPPFTYLHWGRTPSATNPRGWVSGEVEYHFSDLEECAVHTLAHECFHFLSDSGQVDEKNTEANANWWADDWLATYQQEISADRVQATASSDILAC